MAFDEMTAQAMRDVARLEQRVAELEAALRRLQCEIGVSVEAHDVIVKAIGTPQRPIAGVQALAVPASGPLRDLGAYLARVLDEDQWAHAEALLLKSADGVSASVSHPLPAQANDGGEHG